MLDIKIISGFKTYPLRYKVLRPHQPPEASAYPADNNPDTFHLGAYDGQQLISIASFFREEKSGLEGDHHYRLRGMATEPANQRQGVGTALLVRAMDILASRKAQVLWCNARTNASAFYLANDFKIFGELFEIVPIGMHYVMYRRVSES